MNPRSISKNLLVLLPLSVALAIGCGKKDRAVTPDEQEEINEKAEEAAEESEEATDEAAEANEAAAEANEEAADAAAD